MSVVIHGTVVDLAGRPAPGQRVAVLAWAAGSAVSALLAQGFADQEGRFRIEYGEPAAGSRASACALDAAGRLLGWSEDLESLPAGALVRIVLGAAGPTPAAADRPEDTRLDLSPAASQVSQVPPPAPRGEEFVVHGRIGWPDGTPVIGAVVRAVDRDLRGEQPLGPYAPDFRHETRTDAAGRYRIPYLGEQFGADEIGSADLVVRVLDARGGIAAASAVLFNAPREAEVDLAVPARVPGLPAEFERVAELIERLLGEGGDVSQITVSDVPFLVGETKVPADRFSALISATALAAAAAAVPVPAEAYYGLLRLGDPADLAGLGALGEDRLAGDLDKAVGSGLIADALQGSAQRYAAAIVAEAAQAQQSSVTQSTALADPALRYAQTGSVTNSLVSARLDQALQDAVRTLIGSTDPALTTAMAPALSALSWSDARDSSVADTAVSVLDSASTLDPAIAPAAQAAVARVRQQPSTTVSTALGLTTPLRDNPLFAADLRTATTAAIAGAAGFTGNAFTAVTAAAPGLADDPDRTVAALVASSALTATQGAALRGLIDLSTLTDANIPLFNSLAAQGTTSAQALAGWSTAQWEQHLSAASAAVPPGLTTADYATVITANLELAYPTQALAARLVTPNTPTATFFAANPTLDLRSVDLARGDYTGLSWQGVADTEQPQVEADLRAQQRLLALADTTDARVALSGAGFNSAQSISILTEQDFVGKSGLDEATARMTYARAQDLSTATAHAYGALHDWLRPPWAEVPIANVYPDDIDDLLKIQGVAQLFGPQDYCDCGDCDSVLGPAAYFVDLMHFAEQQVSTPVFVTPGLTGHPLYLKNRRPDLWTLPLTCDNTNTLLPTLQLVDEILEAYLTKLLGTDPYQVLADPTDKATCAVPFSLPYAELGLYLGYFGLSPADVYRTLQLPDATVDRALTGLSADAATVVATADPTGIVQRLGLGSASDLNNLPVQQYLARMGITRDQLTTLLASRYDPDLANVTVAKQQDPGELQNFPEILQNLTAARADAAFRFTLLLKALPWALGDLDLVLLAAQQAAIVGTSLDAPTVQLVGRLVKAQKALSVSVQQLCAVIGDMPVSTSFPVPPPHTSDELLYEQVFDLPDIFGVKNTTTGELNQSVDYYEYTLDTTLGTNPPVIDPRTPLLLAGLGISETDLLQLFALLSALIPFSAAGHTTLDRDKLSLLYRHASVARALGLSISDLIAALGLLFPVSGRPLTTLAQVEQLIGFAAWTGASAFTVAQLQLVLTGAPSADAQYSNTTQTVAALVQSVQSADATASGGAAPDPVATLTAKLAVLFDAGASRLTDLLTWTGQTLNTAPIKTALAATFTNGVPDNPADLAPLLALVQRLERVALLFTQLQASDDTVDYLTTSYAQLGIADRTALVYADVQALSAYAGYCARTIAPSVETTPLPTSGAAGSGTNAETLTRALLTAYATGGAFGPDQHSALALLTGAEQSLVDSVLAAFTPLPAVPITALNRVDELVARCKVLGVNAYSLVKLGQDATFADLSAAAQVAVGAVGAQYTDQDARAKALSPYQDQVNTLKRDALCGYLIDGRPELHFTSEDDLYDYFLIDVEMGGCGRTSRLVSAISSVQLYVQRCLMNLEQSDPAITTVPAVHVDPTAIPQAQWDWRKNFRVWQANREVFLYPENYLVPDLRDDKSPEFADLENALLQRQITDDAVTDAYTGYLADLAELAHLKITGTYYDTTSTTYYFFGRTQQDPPTHYYRTWDTTSWSPWTKIDMPIDGPYLAAAVHLGRLYVFWVDVTAKDHTTISGGASSTDYATVRVQLVYSVLGPDGAWKHPQKLDWLYPSDNETISAVDQVFPGVDGDVDAEVAVMELQKTTYKTYPAAVGDSILLRYYNASLNSNYYFDRVLDLFHNRLVGGGGIPGLPTGTPVGFYTSGGSAVLGIETKNYGTELDFDLTREQGGPPPTTITTSFGYDDRDYNDPALTYYSHAVHRGFPETVILLGDQQFLVHEQKTWRYGTAQASISDAAVTSRAVSASASARATASASASASASKPAVSASLSQYLISPSPILFTGLTTASSRRLVRLSTSVADQLGETEANDGVAQLLALATQQGAIEKPLPFTITAPAQLAAPADDPNHVTLDGAFGGYYAELFFYIPWLIASQLNAAGQYEDAMHWYQHVFDPTAAESPSDSTPRDRVWRYVGFRGLTTPTLEQIITDPAALAAYRDDPFNPFAIARLRPSAFQKAMVMQFVQNLIDWGDSLFTQDTTESVNEATMLYVLASEILGPRPVSLGECETAPESSLTYAVIGPTLGSASDFLVTLENWVYQTQWQALDAVTTQATTTESTAHVAQASNVAVNINTLSHALLPFSTVSSIVASRAQAPSQWLNAPIDVQFPPQFVPQTTLVFCVPPNDTLLGYWDTVADRLSKIRNCQNISGVTQQLPLFAPPINPMDLVRARAAGLSIEQAVASLDAPVPVYRFTTMLDRARSAAQTVSAFGASLLAALERKDAEELTLLLSLHQRTILNLTTAVKQAQLEESQDLQQAQADAVTNAQNQVSYYQNLLANGLNSWETVEEDTRNSAMALKLAESVVHLMAALTYLIPQVGSPFAMKYGGQELGHSGVEFADWTGAMAGVLTHVADSAAMEARFDRRSQEWSQELLTASQTLAEAQQRSNAADARAAYSQADLDQHLKAIDQAAELDEFYRDKFTSLGLYTYLARTLTQLHRMAYDAAYQLAQAAQQAYRFETDDSTVFIAPDNWEGDKAGLLSGERLTVQLQQLENSFLAGNTRRYEVTQLFPLSAVAPGALLALRETGSCTFDLPELLFDVVYPGQYKRLVKSVRVTLPGVVGPYTTVGAKLTMTANSVRATPTAALTAMTAQPNIASAIATSTGVGDSGLFDLNFRDERYLPFEGAGAVSSWRLELPAQLRAFDYGTISDVVVHLSYTALDDDAFRTSVESSIVSALTKTAQTNGLFRLFSLRFDFPAAYAQLTGPTAPANTSTTFTVDAARFPYFLTSTTLDATSAQLYLLPQGAAPVNTSGLDLSLNGTAASAWTTDPTTGLPTASVPLSGALLGNWTLAVPSGHLDPTTAADVLILVKYKIA